MNARQEVKTMGKPFYSDYVRHCLRFYSRNVIKPSVFKSDVDKNNWLSCYAVLKFYTDREKDMLIAVYSGYDTLPDEVYNASRKFNINQNIIWDLMKKVEHRVAKLRGLI